MDLNEWLRGERDWLELVEFLEEFKLQAGSHYRAARLRDPRLVEQMVAAPEKRTPPKPPRLEDFSPLRADLADIKDLLWRVVYAAAQADAKHAPTERRPELPWETRKSEIASARSRAVQAILLPWEVN